MNKYCQDCGNCFPECCDCDEVKDGEIKALKLEIAKLKKRLKDVNIRVPNYGGDFFYLNEDKEYVYYSSSDNMVISKFDKACHVWTMHLV